MKKFLIASLLSSFIVTKIFAQLSDIRLKQLDINSGLSSNNVSSVLRDSRGFMWFGTDNGLNRFDGYDYKNFLHDESDTSSLSSSTIVCSIEDRDSSIWIGTENGLNSYNPRTGKFKRYFHSKLTNSISGNYINCLNIDAQNNLWIGTISGLSVYNSQTKEFLNVTTNNIPLNLNKESISSILFDKKGTAYILTYSGYFLSYSLTNDKVQIINKFTNVLPFIKQERLLLDNYSRIWVCYGKSIYIYNPVNKGFEKLENFNAAVNAIIQDNDNYIWIGTTDKGLYVFDNTYNRFLRQFHVGNLVSDAIMPGAGIRNLYFDKQGVIWISTYDGGLGYYHKNLFRFDKISYNQINNFIDERVNCILQSCKSIIYVGTERGLFILDIQTKKFTPISTIKDIPILAIYEDSEKYIWISTYYGELYKGTGSKFSLVKTGSDSIKASVLCFAEDKTGTIWLGTMNRGIYTVQNNKIESFEDKYGFHLVSPIVNQMIFDSQRNLWIATQDGINVLTATNEFKTYTKVRNEEINHVNQIVEDSRGRIWIGCGSGLLLYDNKTDDFILFNKRNGLSAEQVMGIQEDSNGSFWISTTNGLFHVVMKGDDIKNIRFRGYYEEDGLPGNIFKRAIAKLTNGEILIGSMKGIGLIQPNKLTSNEIAPIVQLTDFRVFNKIINVGEKIDDEVILPQNIFALSKLELPHFITFFTIDFATNSIFDSKKCIYKYILKGFSKDWIITDYSMRHATFTNLNPGTYTFCLKASYDGIVWGPEKELTIVVNPPFWLSNTSKIIYLILIVFLIAILRYLAKINERQRIVLEMEKIEAQRLHNLDMMKINLFTNISHEFRTPLALIITPLEKIMAENKSKYLEKPFQTMHRNAQRLLHLINQLLDFRKIDTYELQYQPSTGDIIAFTRNIALSFNDIAEEKGMNFIFNSNIKELLMQFDHDKYEKIIYNLLSNAFKYTHAKGSVAIEINFIEELNLFADNKKDENLKKHGELSVKVKDTGIGIPKKLQESIFERFFQVNNLDFANQNSSGIGLSLVNEYVKIHSGKISVESEEDKGSCFTVKLPVEVLASNKLERSVSEKEIQEILADANSGEMAAIANGGQITHSILLVEDNEELRFYLKDNLKSQFKIFEAENGSIGFQRALEYLPDIVISDILMPDTDGISLCQQIKNEPTTSHIPVILLTAMNSDNYKLEGLQAGADDFIVKPFNFKLLEARIKNLLHKQSEMQKGIFSKFEIEPRDVNIVSLDEQFVKKALELVETNMDNCNFTVEEFSKEMAMSRMLLYKKLLALTGKTPVDFIRTLRLKRSAQLLSKSQMTISEVATKVGFSDPKYFSQCFKKEFKMLPSEYIAKSSEK